MLDKLMAWSGQPVPQILSTKGRTTRAAKDRPYANGALAKKIEQIKAERGLVDEQLSEGLSKCLGFDVSLTTVWNWRTGKYLPNAGDSRAVDAVMGCLTQIENEHAVIDGGAWVSPEEIRASIEEWRKGLGDVKLFTLATILDIPLTTLLRWNAGMYNLRRERLNILQQKYENEIKKQTND